MYGPADARNLETAAARARKLAAKVGGPFFVVYDPSETSVTGYYHVATDEQCDTHYNGAEVVYCTED